jgi:hypothetical protein
MSESQQYRDGLPPSTDPASCRTLACHALAVIGLALALQAVAIVTTHGYDSDGIVFMWNAQDLAEGDLDTPMLLRKPLLYPLLVAGGVACGLPAEAAASIVNVLAGTLAAIIVWRLGLELGDRPKALIAGLFMASLSPMVNSAGRALDTSLHVALFAGLMLAVVIGIRRKGLWPMLAAGLCLGAMAILRFEALATAVPVGLAVAFRDGLRLWRTLRWKAAAIVLVLVPAVSGLLPYGLMARARVGRFLTMPPAMTRTIERPRMPEDLVLEGAPTDPDEPVAPEHRREALRRVFLPSVRAMLERLGHMGLMFMKASAYVFTLLGVIGLLVRLATRSWRRGEGFLLLVTIWQPLALLPVTGGTMRYLLPLMPAMLWWSAVAVTSAGGPFRRRWRLGAMAGLVALTIGGQAPEIAKPKQTQGRARRAVGRFIQADAATRGIDPQALSVAAPVPQFAWYADARWVEIVRPDSGAWRSLPAFIEVARRHGVQYFVVEMWNVNMPRKGMFHRFDETLPTTGLDLLKTFDEKALRGDADDGDPKQWIRVYYIPPKEPIPYTVPSGVRTP